MAAIAGDEADDEAARLQAALKDPMFADIDLPALESAHAIAHAKKVARELGPAALVLINLSGRGDKDVQTVEKVIGGRS